MSQLDEVESLLEQLSGEGELASRGQFTLDPSKSRQKIGQYLESDQASWANWWVRAMFALGCNGLHLQLGRQTLLLTASFPAHSVGLDGLSAFLTRGHDPSNAPALGLLRNGLLWLQALMDLEAGLKVSLLLQDCGLDCGFWKLTQNGLEAGPPPQGSEQPLLRLTLQSPNLGPVRAQLASTFAQKLAYATAPVRLDGRRLNPEAPAGDLLFARYYLGPADHQLVVPAPEALPAHHYAVGNQVFDRPRLATPPSRVAHFSLAGHLASDIRWSASAGQPLLTFQHAGENHQLHLEGADPFPLAENWQEASQPWKVPVAFFRSFEGPDQVIVVDHGLCLEASPLRLARDKNLDLGWKVLVARNGIQTDLSGIKPVEDPPYQRMLAWVREEVRAIHQQQH
ncbi:MAG: hypothetical protein KF760_32745 [Candidatus Eremiobacteraeota bacterium]|nr:hypothetical protein [Candidatus Eremiobacteraeota bacterium]MCW5868557.1 hypothetical protein [Candidatus Eremiobacteraeota bacterium]